MSTLFGIQGAGCRNNAQFSVSRERERERGRICDDTRLDFKFLIAVKQSAS